MIRRFRSNQLGAGALTDTYQEIVLRSCRHTHREINPMKLLRRCVLAAICAAGLGVPVQAETVKVGMPIPVTLTDLGYYVFGEELGFFK